MAHPHFKTSVHIVSYEYVSCEPITKESAKKVTDQDKNIYTSSYIPEYYYFDMHKIHKIRDLIIEFGQSVSCHCPREGNHCDINTYQFDTKEKCDTIFTGKNSVSEILYSTIVFLAGFALGDYLARRR